MRHCNWSTLGSWRLRTLLIFAVVLWTAHPARAIATDKEWTDLVVDGKMSDRWETEGNWRVDRDGVVILTPRAGEKGWRRFAHYIWSKDQFADFEIRFEYRCEKQGNSGFYFHVGDKSQPVEKGIEVQLFDSYGKPAGSKLDDHDSGGIIPKIPPTKNTARPPGEWNQVQVIVKDGRVKIILNDELVNDISLQHPNIKDRPTKGYIGFQDHGLSFALRNVKVRALD